MWTVLAFLLGWAALQNVPSNFEGFIMVVGYWIGPWLNTILMDQYIKRKVDVTGLLYDNTLSYKWGLFSVAIAVISFLVWGHHLFVSGQSELVGILFSFLTFAVGVPTAIKVFSWIATLYRGSIVYNTAMWYAMAFLWTFSVGGLTGLPLSTLAIDVHLHDTYFVVAHFHYVMVGGTVIAFIGGIHHWWPKITGKMFNESAGKLGAFLVFVGFNVTFLTQFFLGHQGMPRRYYAYLPEYQLMHQVSTIGSWILMVGLFVVLFTLLFSLKNGEKAPANPWGGISLEWQAASPPIEHNFHETPHVHGSPYDFPEIDKSAGFHAH